MAGMLPRDGPAPAPPRTRGVRERRCGTLPRVLAVLRRPGVLPLFAASCVARLPMGALGLLLVLLEEERTGSYARGGAVAGVYVLAVGVFAPWLARLIDRRGQTAVLRIGATVSAAAIATLALLPAVTPLGASLAVAALAGALQPPMAACMRALWPELVEVGPARHNAYALESVALEIVYIAGPAVIVAGVGSISLNLALGVAAAALFVGAWSFSLHPVSRARAGTVLAERDLIGALRGRGVRVLLVVFALLGLTVGAVEVVVAGFTGGDEDMSGLLLGLWGLGSLLAGIVIARVGAAGDGPRRLAILVGAWGLAHALIGLADSTVTLGALLLVAGATIAPTFVTANGLLDHIVPDGQLTEAFTWTSTGITAGVAAGNVLAGLMIDHGSPGLAIGLLGGFTALTAVVVVRASGPALAGSGYA